MGAHDVFRLQLLFAVEIDGPAGVGFFELRAAGGVFAVHTVGGGEKEFFDTGNGIKETGKGLDIHLSPLRGVFKEIIHIMQGREVKHRKRFSGAVRRKAFYVRRVCDIAPHVFGAGVRYRRRGIAHGCRDFFPRMRGKIFY